MRLIDADELKGLYDPENYGVDENWDDVPRTFAEIRADIDDQPTVDVMDVMKVVRCENCENSTPWYRDKSRCFLWVEDGIDVFNDGFCSYWIERKK